MTVVNKSPIPIEIPPARIIGKLCFFLFEGLSTILYFLPINSEKGMEKYVAKEDIKKVKKHIKINEY